MTLTLIDPKTLGVSRCRHEVILVYCLIAVIFYFVRSMLVRVSVQYGRCSSERETPCPVSSFLTNWTHCAQDAQKLLMWGVGNGGQNACMRHLHVLVCCMPSWWGEWLTLPSLMSNLTHPKPFHECNLSPHTNGSFGGLTVSTSAYSAAVSLPV